MAIATVLVGSAAALSSAGIAVPVGEVGFAKGWNEPAPAAPARAVEATLASLPRLGLRQAPAPALAVVPVRRVDVPMPGALAQMAVSAAPKPRIADIQAPELVAPPATTVFLTPGQGELAPLPLETPVTLVVQSAPSPLDAGGAGLAPALPVAELASPAAAPLPAAEPPLRLVNPPELRGFDLARLSSPARPAPARLAARPAKPAAAAKAGALGSKDRVVGEVLYHQVALSIAGANATSIDVRIGADMKPSLKVGDLLGLVAERMDPDSAARFAAAAAAGDYVSLATLRAAGFDVSYSAGSDTISIGLAQ